MVDKKNLTKFSISELKEFRTHVKKATTKEELLEALDEMISSKEEQSSRSLNSRFLVDWMNIDLGYRQLLHDNGIDTEQQLLEVENLWSLHGMTQGAHEQISWAKDFFDMSPIEQIPEEKRSLETVTKVIVKQANEVAKKQKLGK